MATSSFDFDSYNAAMKNANSGLRLYLAIQSLHEVETVFRRFNSPFASDMIDLVDRLNDLRERNKTYLAKRENSGNSSEAIDNATLPGGDLTKASNSADAGKVS